MPATILESSITLFQMICVIIIFAYLFTRSRLFLEVLEHKTSPLTRIILASVFGLLSIYGTISGVTLYGAVLNVRDLGPMIAGLTCGPYVGIAAGLIGGIYRYSLGGPYMYTGFIAPVLSGALAGILYLANKKSFVPTRIAVVFAVLTESLISLMALLIATPPSQFLTILTVVAIPMITINTVAVFIFSTIIHNLLEERRTKAEKESLEREIARKNAELEIAADIQRSFLPETLPVTEGFDIAAKSLPAKEVGGDFFDVIPLEVIALSPRRTALLIADVSGKGVPAALFMALSRVIVRVTATWFPRPAVAMERANLIITNDSKRGMFVTLFYGVLERDSLTLSFVNAGHNPPLLYRVDRGGFEELKATGIAFGIMEDATYEENQVSLAPGDVLVLFTDGVTEAINEKDEMFETERLKTVISDRQGSPASEIADTIIREVFAFSGNQPQFDDITLIVVKVL